MMLRLRHDETKQEPRVEVLEAVVWKARLMARHPAEGAEVDVVIQTVDIGVAMMEDVVLPSPYVGAGAEQVEHAAHGAIHDARRREGAMIAIVGNVEADAGESQSQGDAEESHLPPALGPGQQGQVGGAAPQQEQLRLEVDTPSFV